MYQQLDIDSLESIKRFRDFIKDTHGGLDVLVNNAATAYKVVLMHINELLKLFEIVNFIN